MDLEIKVSLRRIPPSATKDLGEFLLIQKKEIQKITSKT